MKRTSLIAAAALIAVASTAVIATAHDRGMARGDGPRDGRGAPMFMFDEFDMNGDGSVTMDEIKAAGEARFAKADTNGDGLLSADEMQAAAEAERAARMEQRMADRIAERIERQDTDGDGMLSLEEATTMPAQMPFERMFDRLDADGDGAITKAELEAVKGHFGMRGHGPRDGHGRWDD